MLNRLLDIYNEWIREKYGTDTHFVLKKEVLRGNITKSMKTFRYSLWYVNKRTTIEINRFEHTITGSTSFKEEAARILLADQVTRRLMSLYSDSEFNNMMEGKFKGYESSENREL